jgi:hypothetical protein
LVALISPRALAFAGLALARFVVALALALAGFVVALALVVALAGLVAAVAGLVVAPIVDVTLVAASRVETRIENGREVNTHTSGLAARFVTDLAAAAGTTVPTTTATTAAAGIAYTTAARTAAAGPTAAGAAPTPASAPATRANPGITTARIASPAATATATAWGGESILCLLQKR